MDKNCIEGAANQGEATEKGVLLAAASSRRWWHNIAMALNRVLTIVYFDRLDVPRLS
jgi:hypothetical protein